MKVGAFKKQEINKLVRRGLTYRRIAQRLGIPLATIYYNTSTRAKQNKRIKTGRGGRSRVEEKLNKKESFDPLEALATVLIILNQKYIRWDFERWKRDHPDPNYDEILEFMKKKVMEYRNYYIRSK